MSGVDRSRPKGPHSQVQNDAAMTTATGDRPALRPQTNGSTTCPVSGSTTANKITVQNVIVQSLPTAAAKSDRQAGSQDGADIGRQLRAGAAQLSQQLSRAELQPGDIVIRDGAPPQAAPARAGHFLDRAL